jgi:AcrR family transcriptional regulator
VVRTRPDAAAAPPLPADLPVRDRIMATACRLFYDEGIQAVGIQRIIDEAGIAKASLYAHFASKDDLVAAYLDQKAQSTRSTLAAHLENPRLGARAKILKCFDVMVEAAACPKFRGCAFQNASTEIADPQHPIRLAAREQRRWLHEVFTSLGREVTGNAATGDRLAGALMVLYDGAAATAAIDGDPAAARHARWAAEKMLA